MTLFLYVLRLLSAGVVVSVGGMFFIAIPGIVVSAVHTLGGVSMSALIGYLPIVVVDLVPYLMPIGFLLALVATYGRLAADNEWTAINMAGFHPVRMMLPAALVALVLGGVSHYLATEVSPGLAFERKQYLATTLVKSFKDVNPGRTEVAIGDFYLSARSRDPGTNVFRNVTIYVPAELELGADKKKQEAKDKQKEKDNDKPTMAGRTVLADVAEFSFSGETMRVDLKRARTADDGHDRQAEFVTISIDIDALLEVKSKNRADWRYQSSRELRRMLAEGRVPERSLRSAEYELHRRDSMTATYLLFLLLGVPTGLLLRRGTQLGALAAAVCYALAYYLLSIRLSKTLANWGTIPPAVGAWATVTLGSIAGLFLCWRAFRR